MICSARTEAAAMFLLLGVTRPISAEMELRFARGKVQPAVLSTTASTGHM
jgi:hypothetical protein